MGKYDARNRGRFSNVGAPPRGMEKLGYVPVVKSAVVDQDEWRDMKRADVDPEWADEPPADEDFPLPEDLGNSEGELPLPERTSSPEDLPVPDLGVSLADGDLPLPDLGVSLADGDLPLPRFETLADDEGRFGLLPAAPVEAVTSAAQASVEPERPAPEAREREPAFESQPVRIGGRDPYPFQAGGSPAAFSEPPRTGRMSAPAPLYAQRKPSIADNDVSLEPPPPGATSGVNGPSTFSEAPSLASLRAAAPQFAAPAAPAPEMRLSSPAPTAGVPSAPPDLGSSEVARRFQALVAPIDLGESNSVPAPESADPLIGTEAPLFASSAPPAAAPAEPPSRPMPAPESASTPAASPAALRPAPARPPPPPPGRVSTFSSDEARLAHARMCMETGRLDDALALLEPLCAQQPEHEACRGLLLDVCCKLPRASKAIGHAEWLMVRLLQTQRPADATGIYRLVRATFPELPLPERLLVAAVEAADRAGDSQVVVDAAKLLVHGYPESAYVTRVLTKAADQQLASGRADLARATLEYLSARYPNDPLAQAAKQRLLAGR